VFVPFWIILRCCVEHFNSVRLGMSFDEIPTTAVIPFSYLGSLGCP